MPLNRRSQSSSPIQPQPSIADVDTSAIDGTYSIEEQTVIQSLRSDVDAILVTLRSVGILQVQVGSRDRASLTALTYASVNDSSYTYYSTGLDMTALNDGNLTNGMMANQNKVFAQLKLSRSAYLNKINVYAGQFNGAYNIPQTLKVYAGAVVDDTAAPLYQATLAVTTSLQSFDVSNAPGFDVSSAEYTFVFSNSSDTTISVNELQLFGGYA